MIGTSHRQCNNTRKAGKGPGSDRTKSTARIDPNLEPSSREARETSADPGPSSLTACSGMIPPQSNPLIKPQPEPRCNHGTTTPGSWPSGIMADGASRRLPHDGCVVPPQAYRRGAPLIAAGRRPRRCPYRRVQAVAKAARLVRSSEAATQAAGATPGPRGRFFWQRQRSRRRRETGGCPLSAPAQRSAPCVSSCFGTCRGAS
jgi:hypothetical protein